MPGPIATIGSMHICPMCNGSTPHIGGPISGPGAPNIMINGKTAALMGDICICVGSPDMIAQGAAAVFFNGIPVACQGDITAHGGIITEGEANVVIGSAMAQPSVTMSVTKIPFPEISLVNHILDNTREAQANQEKLKQDEIENDLDPYIYNLQWIKEEKVIRGSKVIKQVMLKADVRNISDGETVIIKVKKPTAQKNEEPEIVALSGQVQDKTVTVLWETEDTPNHHT